MFRLRTVPHGSLQPATSHVDLVYCVLHNATASNADDHFRGIRNLVRGSIHSSDAPVHNCLPNRSWTDTLLHWIGTVQPGRSLFGDGVGKFRCRNVQPHHQYGVPDHAARLGSVCVSSVFRLLCHAGSTGQEVPSGDARSFRWRCGPADGQRVSVEDLTSLNLEQKFNFLNPQHFPGLLPINLFQIVYLFHQTLTLTTTTSSMVCLCLAATTIGLSQHFSS
uniref:(northern house mosquito) hypothetical protein n=1 Tax=Culex pipiens TaxID=7175 RepID=A0A8D8L282_CULPI